MAFTSIPTYAAEDTLNTVETDQNILDEKEDKKIGVIAIDSLYSPIERVAYEVQSARVGQDESYDDGFRCWCRRFHRRRRRI